MTEVIAFLLGLGAGLLNQAIVWLTVVRLRPGSEPGSKQAALARFLGSFIVRFLVDGLAIYASWRLWDKPTALIMTVTGLFTASAAFVGWEVSMRKRGVWRGGRGT